MSVQVVRKIGMSEVDCCACGLVFMVPEDWEAERRKSGTGFYCPNGHSLTWGKSEADKLRERVASLEAKLTHAQDQRAAAERDAQQSRQEAERQRKRAANGVCPCCNRTFVNLGRHMRGQHPDYAGSKR